MSELIYILLLLLVNSFLIIGWNKATDFELTDDGYDFIERMRIEKSTCWESGVIKRIDDRMIFWKARFWALKTFGQFWSKPIFTCPTCMASVHSLYVYWLFMPLTLHSLVIYPIYILSLAGLVTYINNRV